jgi:hypothetical protein
MGDVTPALALRRTGGPGGRSGARWAAYGGVLVVVVAVLAWLATHPASLPTSDKRIRASAPVGQAVFLGVFVAPEDFGRTLDLNGVRVFATASVGTTIVPHVCHGGSVSVTTDPVSFCASVGPTEGATLGAGDEVVLEVTGSAPGVAEIDRVRIAYRDGVQWAVQDAGAPAEVQFLAR